MKRFFNFSTLNVELISSTKTLIIQLNRPSFGNKINYQLIEELDNILSWSGKHIEVESIYIEGSEGFLSKGLDLEEFRNLSIEQTATLLTRFQKIVYGLMHLPQTVIINAGKQCHNIAAELLLGADIVLANKDCEISFNHLQIGLIPQSGGISLLQRVVSPTISRNRILNGTPVPADSLLSSGLVFEFFDHKYNKTPLLENIHRQSQLARIQTKAALLACKREYFESAMQIEFTYGLPSNRAQDWKKSSFTNPKELFNEVLKEKPTHA